MKFSKHAITIFYLLAMLTACKDGANIVNEPPPAAPVITSVTPDRGKSGTQVTITGSHFGPSAEANTVTFNGMEAAITSAADTQLVTEVPRDAGSGPISVTVAGRTTSGPEFTYFPDNARFVHGTGVNAGNECTEEANPCATIAYALSRANPGDLIFIAPGAYTETLTINKTITLQGAGQDPLSGTVIQAHQNVRDATKRVISISGGNVVSIRDLTIRHGNVLSEEVSNTSGGGIRVIGSTLNLFNTTLEKNLSECGGGIFTLHGSGTYSNVIFRNNTAVMEKTNCGNGGGLLNNSGSLTLEGVEFFQNKADTEGGGMFNSGFSSPVELINIRFTENSAPTGGGIYISSGNVSLSKAEFIGNEAISTPPGGADGDGGGLYINAGSEVMLTQVEFNANRAGRNGGGMYNLRSSPSLTDVTFAGNTAKSGGGMYSRNEPGDTEFAPVLNRVTFNQNRAEGGSGGGMYNRRVSATLTNVSFRENESTFNGGGMHNDLSTSPSLANVLFEGNSCGANGGGLSIDLGSSPALMNVTFSVNESGMLGGGIFNRGSPQLINTIIWGNTAHNSGNEIHNAGTAFELVYSIFGNGEGDVVEGLNFTAEHSLTEDPLFMDTTNGNLRLQTVSQAIDAGDPDTDLSFFAIGGGNPVDLDDNPRMVGDRIDIGAYEHQDN